MKRLAPIALLLLAAAPAPTATQHFNQGRFAAAIAAGRAEATAPGLAVAARAGLVAASLSAPTRADALAAVTTAERDADAALKLAPGDYDATLQKGSAIGFRAELTTSRRLATASRETFEGLTERAPDKAAGWVALGVWHGGAVESLGALVARMAIGGSRREMERALAEAARRDPRSPLPPAHLALMRLRLGDKPDAAQALLARAAALPARDGYEALVKRYAAEVSALLADGDPTAARAKARAVASFRRLK